ncbi:MAG: type III-B CRISPR module RAMP protein Cmr1 [Bacteroidia bacterium]|nr:type III-B CRISPR module RAMP protein Cmr1 [Bacteroidia bacterium]MDW8157473.1 type III-B CRISPR module RAMP protein Cmr1 [Bacteroidia bacterium]
MYKAIVSCEVITPMFIAGADGKTPELRAASIKGVMRFWWRALQGEPDLGKLRQKETELFGGTSGEGKKGIAARKSAVKIWVQKLRFQIENNPQKFREEGINYLFYSMITMKDNRRKYYKPGTSFEIVLLSREEQKLEQALYSLEAASLFGGLGSRTRRGAGSFCIKKVEINGKSEKKWILPNTDDPYEVKDFIKQVVKPLSFSPNYTTLKNSKVLIFEPREDWQSALAVIGNAFKNFREKNKAKAYETPAFGFPILHGIREGNTRSYGGFLKTNGKYEEIGRRASPVILKVIKAEENYFPIVVHFTNEFLPPGAMISFAKGRNVDLNGKQPTTSLVNEFIKQLTSLNSYSLKVEF